MAAFGSRQDSDAWLSDSAAWARLFRSVASEPGKAQARRCVSEAIQATSVRAHGPRPNNAPFAERRIEGHGQGFNIPSNRLAIRNRQRPFEFT